MAKSDEQVIEEFDEAVNMSSKELEGSVAAGCAVQWSADYIDERGWL